ncbi:hypothetical protein PR048_000172 [Dryococelus australis]|uniref:C2H2-type domain-containing protein n=1 Tax=Dryococelus australis TaxID=614101 RepID=A0ABQ9IF61_9NEOP|nr:hypothetical protein PR048_000172 [Dryococelus australis]
MVYVVMSTENGVFLADSAVANIRSVLCVSGGVYAAAASNDGWKARLHQCPGCGRTYRWRKTLVRHIRLECGKEPQFQCPYCPKRSSQKSNLIQHIRIRHSDWE